MIEEEVIKRAITNDKDAFRIIFNTYKHKVFRTAYLILKDSQYAEDAVQETFLQVHLQIHKLTNARAFEGWLYKINVNICFSIIKKSRKFDTMPIDDTIEDMLSSSEVDFDIPDNIILKKEMQSFIMESIYSLPVKCRTALTLFYFNNLSIKEIADISDCSENTIKSRLFYGKKVMKERLSKNNGDMVNHILGGVVYEG